MSDLFKIHSIHIAYSHDMPAFRHEILLAISLSLLPCLVAGSDRVGSPPALKTGESRTISVRIERPLNQVYEFLVNPENWNRWARGLGSSIRRSKDRWIADSQGGTIEVRFTPRNRFGIVDHYVIRQAGEQVYLPMRLIVNGQGCELLFTLFREPNASDERYASDAAFVQQDLNDLRDLLEK
jgi:hypothetical protein